MMPTNPISVDIMLPITSSIMHDEADQLLAIAPIVGVLQISAVFPTFTSTVPITPIQCLATGGAPPYTFDVSAGALPLGLSMTAGGLITGTPSTAGAYSVTLRVTDALLLTATTPKSGTVL